MKGALFDGIVGVEGRIPFGAIISVGKKGDRGNPIQTDRFFISSTSFEEISGKGGGYRNLRHPLDPRFREFNEMRQGDRRASVLRGNLSFPERGDCMNHHLVAQQLGKGRTQRPPGGGVWDTPPRSMPACTGDGKTAQRFDGLVDGEPQFVEIDCPNRLCPFRTGPKKICGALGRLYFRLRWPDAAQQALEKKNGQCFPSILVRYQTHGWETVENMVGMFDAVEETARGLGMPQDSWTFAGLPFEMTVGMKKIPDKGRSFPVVSFALGDVIGFLRWQTEQREYLLGAPRSVALIGDGMDHEEGSLEGVNEALDHITPGFGIPATAESPGEDDVVDVEEVPEVTVYRVDPDDPRSAYDRLREHCIEALGLTQGDLYQACKKAAGCEPKKVVEMFESAVAEELESMAKAKR